MENRVSRWFLSNIQHQKFGIGPKNITQKGNFFGSLSESLRAAFEAARKKIELVLKQAQVLLPGAVYGELLLMFSPGYFIGKAFTISYSG